MIKWGCIQVEAHCEMCLANSPTWAPRLSVLLRVTRGQGDWNQVDGTGMNSAVHYEWNNGKLSLFCPTHAPPTAARAEPI